MPQNRFVLFAAALLAPAVVGSQEIRVKPEWPDLLLVAAGGVPDSRQDGGMWSGRGLSTRLRGGVRVDVGALHVVLAPEAWHASNRPFDLIRGGDSSRSTFASPYYIGVNSMDLPTRMGIDPVTEFSFGESSLWGEWKGAALGVSTSMVSWGPSERQGLMFGHGAPGIPRVFLRTPRPLATRFGQFSMEWFVGALSESRWFDSDGSNDLRSLSAGQVRWSPRANENLSVGIARAVQQVVPSGGDVLGHAFDFLSEAPAYNSDRMRSAFVRFAIPPSGLRVWMELATPRPLGRIRDLLTVPGLDLGYQFGAEQLIGQDSTGWLVHAEVSSLEPGRMVRDAPTRVFYAGQGTPHGWTQRGQLLGGDTGPGSNSQWISVDRVTHRWSLGGYGERVRWNNDVLPTLYLPTFFRHDVTMRVGMRAAWRTALRGVPYEVALDASAGKRLNYLFQNTTWIEAYRTVDVSVPQLRLMVRPRR